MTLDAAKRWLRDRYLLATHVPRCLPKSETLLRIEARQEAIAALAIIEQERVDAVTLTNSPRIPDLWIVDGGKR